MWYVPEDMKRFLTLPVTSTDALGMSWARILVMDIDVLGVSRTMKFTLMALLAAGMMD